MKHILFALCCLSAPAYADVDQVIDDSILPGYADFSRETANLASLAPSCDRDVIRPAWQATFDAWMKVSHLRLGPIEDQGRALIVAFWPDTRGATPQTLARLIRDEDRIIDAPEGTAQISVAARGLFALELLLYGENFTSTEGYTCDLISALSKDLARIAAEVDSEWRSDFADTLRSAGAPENQIYLSKREAKQALFTVLVTGLEFTADQRLGRPLGSYDRPRPRRAEARRSGRSLRNVRLSIAALHNLAKGIAEGPIPKTDAAFDRAGRRAQMLEDPVFAGVSDPQERLRVEVIAQLVHGARDAVMGEIGPALGVSSGFNANDGD